MDNDRENETSNLNQQIEILNIAIAKEEEKAKQLEERTKYSFIIYRECFQLE